MVSLNVRRWCNQAPAARSMVSANHWLTSIKINRLSWYLTLVSANHPSSNSAQSVRLFCNGNKRLSSKGHTKTKHYEPVQSGVLERKSVARNLRYISRVASESCYVNEDLGTWLGSLSNKNNRFSEFPDGKPVRTSLIFRGHRIGGWLITRSTCC